MSPISICIVNLNRLQDTKELIWDLNRQTFLDFTVTLYDQNSTEEGTAKFYKTLIKNDRYTVIQNNDNVPLNHIWNEFAEKCKTEYMTYLNNDVRITGNYVEDTISTLSDKRVGIVVHATNNRKFSTAKSPTKYILDSSKLKQGWDFSIRKEHWVPIPKSLKFYCGDDFIFEKIHDRQLKVGIVTTSPILHKFGKTIKNMNKEDGAEIRAHFLSDTATYKRLGYMPTNMIPSQSRIQPEMKVLSKESTSESSLSENQPPKKPFPEKSFNETNPCRFNDYNKQLAEHLRDSRNVDGIILDVGISDVRTFNTMLRSAVSNNKLLIGIDDIDPPSDEDDSGDIKTTVTHNPPTTTILKKGDAPKHAADVERADSFTILNGWINDNILGLDTPISFAFVGVFNVIKLQEILPKLWDNIQPGGTIFFPYYFSNVAPAVQAYVDEFFEDKTSMIIKSGLNSRDKHVAIKCFPKPMFAPVRTKPLVVACVLKMNNTNVTNVCDYNEMYVNRLASAIKRHSTVDYEFVCLTDGDPDLIDGDLVNRVIPLEYGLNGWWSKFELFRPEIFGDVQVLYFDLDTLLTDNLDDIMNYGGKFLALHNFSTLVSMASGVMSWQPIYTNHIFYKFVSGMMSGEITTKQFKHGDQEAIGHLLELDIDWVQSLFLNKMRSFKYSCYDGKCSNIPKGCSIVCFHGRPKMGELIDDPVILEHWR